MQTRRMLLEGSPVIVAMRPHERPSRWRMLCISSARLRLTPFAPTEVLAGGLVPLKPRQRSLPSQVALHLREDDGQVQHRPSHGAVLVDGLPEADDFDLFLPQPASSSSTSVSDRPRRSSAATFTQSSGWRAAFRRFSPGRFQEAGGRPSDDSALAGSRRPPRCPCPRRPVAVGQHPALGLQAVYVGVAGAPTCGRIHRPSNHFSLAPSSGMAASYYARQNSGYAQIRPFMTGHAGRTARI